MWTPSLLKQDEGRSLGAKRATEAAPRAAGVLVRGCEQRIDAVNTGSPRQWGARPQLKIRENWNRLSGESERFLVARKRVIRGAKGPQFKVNAEAARAREIDVSMSLATPLRFGRCRERCMPQRRQCRERGVSCAYARYLVRKPDAGKLHVRFDERDLETGPALPRQISTLHPGSGGSKRCPEPRKLSGFRADFVLRITQG